MKLIYVFYVIVDVHNVMVQATQIVQAVQMVILNGLPFQYANKIALLVSMKIISTVLLISTILNANYAIQGVYNVISTT